MNVRRRLRASPPHIRHGRETKPAETISCLHADISGSGATGACTGSDIRLKGMGGRTFVVASRPRLMISSSIGAPMVGVDE
jgi:hypothetical protein